MTKRTTGFLSMAQYYSKLFFFSQCPILAFPVDCHHFKLMLPFQFDFWIVSTLQMLLSQNMSLQKKQKLAVVLGHVGCSDLHWWSFKIILSLGLNLYIWPVLSTEGWGGHWDGKFLTGAKKKTKKKKSPSQPKHLPASGRLPSLCLGPCNRFTQQQK